MLATGRASDYGELIRDLQALGFGEYEARAYIALFKVQPATAYEVSKAADLPKANSYAVLESLSKKGAVQPISEGPVRFVAVAPAILFDRIAAATERRCNRLAKAFPKISHSVDQEYVWSVNGAEALRAKVDEIIDAATSHIWIKTADTLLEPHRPALLRAAKRGVSILIILFGENTERFTFGGKNRTYLHEGSGVPAGNSPFLMTLTRDFKEALIAEFRDEVQGSYTRSKPVVSMADTLLRHEIYFAEIFEKFGDEIQEEFGPALINMRRRYLPSEQVEALEKVLATSNGGAKGRASGRTRSRTGAARGRNVHTTA